MFLILFGQFPLLQRSPDGIASFGIYLLNVAEESGNGRAVGVVLVGTQLDQLLVLCQFGISGDVGFVDETERADDGQWHLAHLEQGGHRAEASLVDEVHQRGVDDVVAMVSQRNLVATKLLCEVEQLLAAVPGAEESREASS